MQAATAFAPRTHTNRRVFPRRQARFPAFVGLVDGEAKPAYGLDVGGGGLQLLTRDAIGRSRGDRVVVVATVANRRVELQAERRWNTRVATVEGVRYRTGLRLLAIADADWDFLMAAMTAEVQGLTAGAPLTAVQRDMLLSSTKQHNVAALLAAAGRLTFERGPRPAIDYAFERYLMRNGRACFALEVRSRRTSAGRTTVHTSRILVAIETDGVWLLA